MTVTNISSWVEGEPLEACGTPLAVEGRSPRGVCFGSWVKGGRLV